MYVLFDLVNKGRETILLFYLPYNVIVVSSSMEFLIPTVYLPKGVASILFLR